MNLLSLWLILQLSLICCKIQLNLDVSWFILLIPSHLLTILFFVLDIWALVAVNAGTFSCLRIRIVSLLLLLILILPAIETALWFIPKLLDERSKPKIKN